jgi:hypothetical protein
MNGAVISFGFFDGPSPYGTGDQEPAPATFRGGGPGQDGLHRDAVAERERREGGLHGDAEYDRALIRHPAVVNKRPLGRCDMAGGLCTQRSFCMKKNGFFGRYRF